MLTLLATVLALAGATTGAATDVSATTATLNGSVEGATKAHFEYGTDAGPRVLHTPEQDVGDGEVRASVSDLTPNTRYHVVLVSDAGEGVDVPFTTTNLTAPRVSDQIASGITTDAATLAASLNPSGAETTYYFQYGRTTGYGNRTARVTVPAGSDPVAVSAAIAGLQPYSRYHWRVVATNAAGTTRGRDHTFRTARLATALTLYSSRETVQWGRGVTLGGRVGGAGVHGMRLTLEQQQFPFDQDFSTVRSTVAGTDGGYLFSVDNVWTTTRYRVVTETLEPVTSAVATVRSAPRATIGARVLGRRRARIAGTIQPAITGELSLQRRLASGRWAQVRHRAVAAAESYAFKVWRQRKRDRRYRVVVLPVRGAYVRAASRSVVVTRRPARARGYRAAAG